MAQFVAENPRVIVNGFIRSGIAGALDGGDNALESGLDDSRDRE